MIHPPVGLYIHLPFCRTKCCYCDFGSVTGQEQLFGPYVDALIRELRDRAAAWRGMVFGSVYLGGGTPTLFPAALLGTLLQACRAELRIAKDAEVTIEANPGTVDVSGLRALVESGVNRLSLGVQSLSDAELRLLGRGHTAAMAHSAYRAGREAGFRNMSLDLIFGLPGQTVSVWVETLERAIALGAEHLSLYCLTMEPGTPLVAAIEAKDLPEPDEDLAAGMYEASMRMLGVAGYAHYEISNWARVGSVEAPTEVPALASRHNLIYWRNGRYLGLGAGAFSYDGFMRAGNVLDPAEYLTRIAQGRDTRADWECPGPAEQIGETLMLGLRLTRGVAWAELRERFVVDLREVFAEQIGELCAQGLLIADDLGIRLSPQGRLLGNRVFAAFLEAASELA